MKEEELLLVAGIGLVAVLMLRKPAPAVYQPPPGQAQAGGGTDWLGQLLQGLLGTAKTALQYQSSNPSAPGYVYDPSGSNLTAG